MESGRICSSYKVVSSSNMLSLLANANLAVADSFSYN